MCAPAASELKLTGLVQTLAAPESTEHQAVAVGSLTLKVTLAFAERTGPLGAEVTVKVGATVSTVKPVLTVLPVSTELLTA